MRDSIYAGEQALRQIRRTRLVLCVAAMTAGCDPAGDVDKVPPFEFGFQTSVKTALTEEGRVAYNTYCVGCHGAQGDGKGPAAVFLDPKPRDFQVANYKFSSTRSGLLPTDEDLKRTITKGLRGSAMPGWDLLPTRTVDALVVFIKTFSPKWEVKRAAAAIPTIHDPYRSLADKSEAIKRGEAVYHGFATCWTCHPSYVPVDKINEYLLVMENPTRDAFRDHLFQSEGKPNVEDEMIYPPDFRRDFVRSGSAVDDLYRSIAAGITGTAMPTWVDSMDYASVTEGNPPLVQPADIWAMAYYVQDLIKQRPAKMARGEVKVRAREQMIYLHGEPPKAAAQPGEFETDEEFEEFEEFEED